ncbi:phasin family protein [Bradyrhizobium sp. SSUT18]|uniref:phasin family protein n=1 Tax=unclassified Bradyrhizobium TaxID=2631580 RepID=UPI00244A0622|nr:MULTISPECIES: phasin family protein [unclassified Bradyrhizobium]MDH2352715.1 phasin family protein [Bradyrhizobium sp. SSUT112]MDH2398883.1 phasin family protein [Bradyrhizobium sp. SSUT18]
MIMGKPRSRQPADVARARRRSLVELTAEVSRAVDEGLAMPPGSVTVFLQDAPQIAQAAPAPMTAPAQEAASVIVASPEPPSSTTTDLILDIAKDFQDHALDGMKAGAQAALDYAKDIAKPRIAGGTSESGGAAAAESHLIEAIGTAAECRAVVLELMKVNAGATLEYARELGRARTLAELVELSSTHARKQCELVLKQTELLRLLAQNMTKPGAR